MAESPKLMSIDDIKKDYPIHLLVWNNVYDELKQYLAGDGIGDEIEKKDVRGRSPLMLAVTLGHLEAAKLLMEKGANVNTVNSEGWNVVQEAVATGDPELVQTVLEWRDYQRYTSRVGGVPELLLKLKEAPDFYVEMKWEFTSWVPLVSSMCPSDTYKVYKQGSKVRIDTTLLGFDQHKWQRGNTSFIFQGTNDEATIMEIDHENKQVFFEEMKVITTADLQILQPNAESVSARLTTPIVTTYVDTDKICFERNKSGLWGWRQDKMEVVNGRDCKVFGASNVELVTKTRCEHLSDQDKAKYKGSKTPLQFLLGIDEERTAGQVEYTHSGNPCQITPEEYFSPGVSLGTRDIGRPKEITTKIQKFKATLWLSEDYPLSLPEQIIPIIDLMAISNSHFAKLKHFIEMQLPAGFPVKIEIPLFHVLNARITFGNIFALDSPVEGVSTIDDGNKLSCVVDDSCFQPPASYAFMGADSRRQVNNLEEDDDMLQYAIQQSLLQSGQDDDQVDIWEALQAQRPNTPYLGDDEEEKQLQRAIEASLSTTSSISGSGLVETDGNSLEENIQQPANNTTAADEDLRRILELSEQEERQRLAALEAERQREEEMLEQVLKLSLMDK
ncbi:ankyrin repeat domain-containing protein 13D isoform X2 [Halyomorpha halys]|uniref:ankyrin repeat domain-containing protein 13D isoform X2 n=1 Tax=Halyomorpha halys TaxID=286706 RepID=UPI0006D4FFED|nr:ankyrin repeat domain-containing protein 13D isoform X2 [Halyomorpha halys]